MLKNILPNFITYLGLFFVVSAHADCNSALNLNQINSKMGLQLSCFSMSAENLVPLDIELLKSMAFQFMDYKTSNSKYINNNTKDLTPQQNSQIQFDLYLKLIYEEPTILMSRNLRLAQETTLFSQYANDCNLWGYQGQCVDEMYAYPSYVVTDSYVLKYQKVKIFIQKQNKELIFISNQLSKDELLQFSTGLFSNIDGLMSGISTVLDKYPNKSLQVSFSLEKFSKKATIKEIPKVGPNAMLAEFGDDLATTLSNNNVLGTLSANNKVGTPISKVPTNSSTGNSQSSDYLNDPCGPVLRQFNEDSCSLQELLMNDPTSIGFP